MSKTDVDIINKELLAYQRIWFDDIVKDWVSTSKANRTKKEYFLRKSGTEEFGFSEPFFTSVYKNGMDLPVVMFVGQETNGWGDYDGFKGTADAIKESQSFVAEFTENNIVKQDKNHRIKECKAYNSHAFWNFIREIYKLTAQAIHVVWTELDKIHYTCSDKKCIKLWEADERILNNVVTMGKTMLLLEIETIKPDLVVFLTGPYYSHSMKAALLNDELTKPTLKNPIQIFDTSSGVTCAWTYHPNGLRRKGLWEKVSNEIGELVLNRK